MSRADKLKVVVGIALYVGSLAYSVRTIVILRREAKEIEAALTEQELLLGKLDFPQES